MQPAGNNSATTSCQSSPGRQPVIDDGRDAQPPTNHPQKESSPRSSSPGRAIIDDRLTPAQHRHVQAMCLYAIEIQIETGPAHTATSTPSTTPAKRTHSPKPADGWCQPRPRRRSAAAPPPIKPRAKRLRACAVPSTTKPRPMSAPTTRRLMLPIALLAAGALLALDSSDHAPKAPVPAHLQGAPPQQRTPATTRRPRPNTDHLSAGPRSRGQRQVADRFLAAWLRCSYHQAPCSPIPGTLSAYAAALARQQGRSLATPAELTARPTIRSLKIVHSCGDAAIAIATYANGEGDRFELHVNLVRERAGWQVFDVAERRRRSPPQTGLTA